MARVLIQEGPLPDSRPGHMQARTPGHHRRFQTTHFSHPLEAPLFLRLVYSSRNALTSFLVVHTTKAGLFLLFVGSPGPQILVESQVHARVMQMS